MALDLIELCGICECCFELMGAIGSIGSRSPSAPPPRAPEEERSERQRRRLPLEKRRGFTLLFQGRRIANIRFLRGEAEGRIASAMSERDLLRLVAAEPANRALRLAASCYLRNLRKNRIRRAG